MEVRVRSPPERPFVINKERNENMFGFGKKEKPEGFKDLPEVRDLMKSLVGEAMNVYVGTTIGFFSGLGKTKEDVKKANAEMLTALQKYVQAEILLDRQRHGHEPSLAELVGLRLT
jgi:hypothetical protein